VDLLAAGVREALRLLVSGDAEVVAILLLSLQVSGAATLISLVLGIPAGAALALLRFPGRTLVVSAVNAGMGLPPVVVGLFVTLLLWRSGPLGAWEILYTPAAIVLAQAVIAAPIVGENIIGMRLAWRSFHAAIRRSASSSTWTSVARRAAASFSAASRR